MVFLDHVQNYIFLQCAPDPYYFFQLILGLRADACLIDRLIWPVWDGFIRRQLELSSQRVDATLAILAKLIDYISTILLYTSIIKVCPISVGY